MKNSLFLLLILHFALIGFSQTNETDEFKYEVNTVDPPLSITKERSIEAKTLSDLNRNFKPAWIREYKSVEISAIINGTMKKAFGKNDVLTEEQKEYIKSADEGTSISINVKYIPENTLKHNDVKEFNSSHLINPENNAQFVGGQKKLENFLKENAIDKIDISIFEGYELAIIKFVVDENGKINEPKLFWPILDKKVEKVLLESIRKMPNWKPAEYASGKKVTQEFAFTVGNHKSCAINLIQVPNE